MKFTVFLSLLFVGTLALPATTNVYEDKDLTKVTKYPKKYNKDVHGLKITPKTKKVTESSYLSYEPSAKLYEMQPPPVESKYFPVEIPDEPQAGIVVPSRDTYFSYDSIPSINLQPPSEAGLANPYLGYTETDGEMKDILRAPRPSSYANTRRYGEGAILLRGEPIPGFLQPPGLETSRSESSYRFIQDPSSYSSYSQYGRRRMDTIPLRAP